MSQNLVNQAAVFYVRNALKVVYEHLRFEIFFRGLYPQIPVKRRGRTWGGKGRKGVVPPRFNLVHSASDLASLGIARCSLPLYHIRSLPLSTNFIDVLGVKRGA
jgi:hypothetical protein